MTSNNIVLNTFALNGTTIAQPTDHHWIERDKLGDDGNGVAVYVTPRQYELKWDFIDTEEFGTIYSQFQAQGVTGSVVASLPKWNTNPYQFYAYSGTIMRELTYDGWFQNYYSNVRLLIVRINGT